MLPLSNEEMLPLSNEEMKLRRSALMITEESVENFHEKYIIYQSFNSWQEMKTEDWWNEEDLNNNTNEGLALDLSTLDSNEVNNEEPGVKTEIACSSWSNLQRSLEGEENHETLTPHREYPPKSPRTPKQLTSQQVAEQSTISPSMFIRSPKQLSQILPFSPRTDIIIQRKKIDVSLVLKSSSKIKNYGTIVASELSQIVQKANSYEEKNTKAEHNDSLDGLTDAFEKLSIATPSRRKRTSSKETKNYEDNVIENIPRFYYPNGEYDENQINEILDKAEIIFKLYDDKLDFLRMDELCKAIGIPLFLKWHLFHHSTSVTNDYITFDDFCFFWKRLASVAHDEASQFIYIVTDGRSKYLIKSDFEPLIMDIIQTLPSLDYLKSDIRFHCSYIETVTCRIFWTVDSSWSERITANELRRSNFLATLRSLETVDDINDISDYFNYEHFFVIYCKFSQICSSEEDYLIADDLERYAEGAIPRIVISRIFSGAVLRSTNSKFIFNYSDFVHFILAEVDKNHPKSIEYWFRVMDLNGDGMVSLDEMEYFYNGIVENIQEMQIETMKFSDVVCLLFDIIKPRSEKYVTLSDLKRSSMSTYFFDTFINWVKYYVKESSECSQRDESMQSDWDRYCTIEHEILIANHDDSGSDEPDEDSI